MGSGRMSSTDWDSFTTAKVAGKSTAHVFTARTIKDTLDPLNIALRESRDSADNPNATPIILGIDVTGSMHVIPDYFVRTGLKPLFQEIYTRRPVSDPHLMFMAIGDVAAGDRAPLQVSQFEADIRIAEQLTDLFLEGKGGGNRSESYTLPWYFAAMKTSLDSYEKRQKKGYLFTVGDEEPPAVILARELQTVFGPGQYTDLSSEQLLEMASRMFHVFHVVVEQGSNCRHDHGAQVSSVWRPLLGQRVLMLSDYTKLSEVIVSAIEVTEGADHAAVAASWSGDTALVVARAVGGLVPAGPGSGVGLVAF